MALLISTINEAIEATSGNDENIAVTPVATIGLEATNVEEAIVELATDLHDLNNMNSISLKYSTLRNE